MKRILLLLCLILLPQIIFAQDSAKELKQPITWFHKASNLMDPRQPGSAPFHMKASFHAGPGLELQKTPEILTGDGVCDETWLNPQEWRLEVTLGTYHAVEVRNHEIHLIEPSSDYEPSRALMLLDAIFNPIDRNYMTNEYRDNNGWVIRNLKQNGISIVALTTNGVAGRASMNYTYFFLPDGHVFLENRSGYVIKYSKYATFMGRDIPRHIEITTEDNRGLLSADVQIDTVDKPGLEIFNLPEGRTATPGDTQRPQQYFRVHRPDLEIDSNGGFGSSIAFGFLVNSVLDRQGKFHEVEYISGSKEGSEKFMENVRKGKSKHPPTIDGYPCELMNPFGAGTF